MILDIKRFRIRNDDAEIVYKSDKMEDVYNYIIKNIDKCNYIEDVIDDIKVDCHELVGAWSEGERPEDLQMF